MTISDVILFRVNAIQYNDYCKRKNESTKFNYALGKMISRTNEIVKRYEEQLEDKRIDLASVDERGNLIKQNNDFLFTPAKQKELLSWIREKYKEEVQLEPYICEAPHDLPESLIEIFKGFVL